MISRPKMLRCSSHEKSPQNFPDRHETLRSIGSRLAQAAPDEVGKRRVASSEAVAQVFEE